MELRAEPDDRTTGIIDAVVVGIAHFDAKGRCVWCNQRFADLLGLGRAELAGRSSSALLPDIAAEGTLRVPAPGGAERQLQVALVPIGAQTGGPGGAVCTLVDVTEQRQAEHQHRMTEAALRSSEARLKEAQRIAHIGSWELDLGSRRLSWSDEVHRIFEIEPGAFAGRYEQFIEVVHPDDREDVQEKLEATVRARGSLITVHRLRMADGRVKFVQERAEVVRDDQGEALTVKGTVQDVTERRHLEDRMQCNLAVLERTGRINTLGEMATSVAHELNQPLMAIGNYAGGAILRLRQQPTADPALLQALERIAGIVERSGDIVKWIRSFVGKRGVQKQRIDINSVIRESLFLARPEARRNSILVREALAVGLAPISGGPVNLQQVIVNLVLNAVEASEDTPAVLREILVETREALSGEIEISVADQGSGLSAEVAASLFQPFVTTKPRGIGMGLSIARTIVEDHGGRIWTEPNSPRGTVFRIRLPALEPDKT